MCVFTMCDHTSSVHMKLRNSPAVNKPFRSLFNNAEIIEQTKKVDPFDPQSDGRSALLKRKLSEEWSPMKKKQVEISYGAERFDTMLIRSDLNTIQRRIFQKQQEVEELKARVASCKKRKFNDLENDIKKWRYGCQQALERFQKDLQDRQGLSPTMEEILSSLGIPEALVRYSSNSDTFYD